LVIIVFFFFVVVVVFFLFLRCGGCCNHLAKCYCNWLNVIVNPLQATSKQWVSNAMLGWSYALAGSIANAMIWTRRFSPSEVNLIFSNPPSNLMCSPWPLFYTTNNKNSFAPLTIPADTNYVLIYHYHIIW